MSNLDDFFKKRDKKKKNVKYPTLNPDEFVKQLEANIVKTEEDNEFQDGSDRVVTSSNANDNLDEEWKPFDSDENKDYSGLRINTQNWKVEDEENENIGSIDDNDKKPACPWKVNTNQNKLDDNNDEESSSTTLNDLTNQKPQAATLAAKLAAAKSSESSQPSTPSMANKEETSTAATSESSTPAAPAGGAYVPPALRRAQNSTADSASASKAATPAASDASSGGKYVPPSLRNKQNTSSDSSMGSAIPTTSVNYRRPNKSQPNINDTLEFPTLDASVSENSTGDKQSNDNNEKFDLPKKSARLDQKSSHEGMIDLQNKFNALSS